MADTYQQRCMKFIACAASAVAPFSALAQPPNEMPWCGSASHPHLSQLDRWATSGAFRVLYASRGEHAPVRAEDANSNDIPDYVEDILTQLQVAQHVFENVWGLTSPLKQKRQRGSLTYIDVFVLASASKSGVAYSGVRSYKLDIDGNQRRCNLRIDLSNQLVRRTFTPVHELFHLYQYGYTQFKVRWYLEGMARWSESAIARRHAPRSAIPDSPDALNALMDSSYEAADFWHRLGEMVDQKQNMALPAEIENRTYVDGHPVFQDFVFRGNTLIRSTLLKLQAKEKSVAKRLGWSQNALREDQKFSPTLNLEVMESALAAFCELAPERIRSMPEVEKLIDSATTLGVIADTCR